MTPRNLSELIVARQFTMSSNTTNSGDSVQESTSSPTEASTSTTPTSPSTDAPTTPPSTSSTTSPTTPPSSSSTSTTETPPSTSTSTTSTSTTDSTPSSIPSSTTTTSTSSTTPSSTTTTTTSSSSTPPPTSSLVFTTTQVSTDPNGSTQFVTVTSTQLTTNTAQSSNPAASTDASGHIITSNDAQSGAMAEPAKIAVAVVVPIAAVALLVIGGIFFWRKRKQRKDAEEERRKEVEDYSYNPNNDPTLPDTGAAGAAGAYEMKEDGSGYRGWGSTTLAGSTGRKASTTMSGGAAGVAYSDATSPTRGNFSDTRSGDGLMNEGSHSPPEGEILGAMGPSANDTRSNGNVHRGPSNASSSYSAAGRSDGSGENAGSFGAPAYLDQYGGNNPYADGAYGQQRPGELGGQPVIRDNPARRNTRIENPSHYPQQSAGISQNF
ncbi:hypothetical protein F4677DRAFT_420336 [Hypoxylon crocopeplum]|nr:hypothetical protein F4677DRAFT_420336 [Hypoxylon crocopeplum]